MRATKPGERLSLDTCSVGCASLSKKRKDQWLVIVDDRTKYLACVPLSAKSESFENIVTFCAWTKAQGNVVKVLRSDYGGEFINARMTEWCKENGVTQEWSMPGTPQQNGAAVRANRTIQQ